MSRRITYPPGVPCWVATLAPDVEAARRFYAAVFGWTFDNIAGTGAPPFYIAARDGDRVASITAPEQPGTWITAVAVDDLDASRQAAVQAGGTAPGESVDIATLGRFHRLHDPAGAEIHIVQPLEGRGAARVNEPGAWSMSLLHVPDLSSVISFYESLFGWRAEPAGPMTLFRLPGYVGGEPEQPGPRDVVAVAMPDEATATAVWTPDFRVTDADATVATATAHGGRVLTEPEDTDAGFRSALLTDPGGARFSISQVLAS